MRQVAHKEYRGVANSFWKHSFLKDDILQKVYMDINKESSSLCSDKKPSILKQTKPNDLSDFPKKVRRGTGRKSTYVVWMLGKLRCKPEQKEKTKDENGKKISGLNTAPIAFAASILLRQRCPQMSAMAYRFSIGVLWHSGAKNQVHRACQILP